ncbi:SH3 domain-containing protein [Paracoccus wurundjeri]|uniref:SH3 domain-containing protein n=1 Tax=Paracoccus onubensis TaxID=1675788 RepID=UPI00272F24F3|nr:SH3 domain-containing protein [Paracoccus onubensis]
MTKSAVIGNIIAVAAAMAIWSAHGMALAEISGTGSGSGQFPDPHVILAQSELPANAKIDRNAGEERGSVTNLPLPRYVSLKGSEGNARRGPSLSHRIDWVFRHAGMPLRVVAEFGHWRRVEDKDGAGGWIHYALLSGVRTAVVVQDMAELRARPNPDSDVVARAESGAIVKLGECNPDWCSISGGGERGWVPKTDIWGADPGEIRE